jgi:quercetin dioxygenase-like cupin family protein
MQPLRPIDWAAAQFNRAGGYQGQVLFGGESCQIIATRVPPGVERPPTHVHPSDQIFYIIEGELEIELGSATVSARAGESVFIPAGLPHHNRNTATTAEVHLEVIAPGVTAGIPLARMLDAGEVAAPWPRPRAEALEGVVKGPDTPQGRMFSMS